MKQLSDRISIFQSAYWQLNSIVCHDTDTTVIWDPAYTDREIEVIRSKVFQMPSADRYLIFTHGDFDHIVGDVYFDDFKKVGTYRTGQKSDQARILHQISDMDDEYYIIRKQAIRYPVLDLVIHESTQKMKLGTLDCIFYQAGGHTPDGMFTIIPSHGLWIAGDYLSDVEFPFIEDDIKAYYKTLDIAIHILNTYDIKFMIPGHGNPSLSKSQIRSRIDSSIRYLDSLSQKEVVDWRKSWGYSPFGKTLDKMHLKNIDYVRSQSL